LVGCERESPAPAVKPPSKLPQAQSPSTAPPNTASAVPPSQISSVAPRRTPAKVDTLTEARKGFVSQLLPADIDPEPLPEPPAGVFQKVAFDSPVGKLGAYVTPDPKNGEKNPAIIWITGGDCNSIGDVWEDRPATNDQSAAAYRQAGIVMMFPSLRGGNDNPGKRESFLGEVDDVIAAADYLAKRPYVDPQRIYLGGHSTGGTLVLLVAESTARFRSVFSFGPVSDVAGYGGRFTHFDDSNPREFELRAPGRWLSSIRSPTFVLEGSDGNIYDLREMAAASTNPAAKFREVPGADHFNILAPVNRLIASKILADTGPKCELEIAGDEVARLFAE